VLPPVVFISIYVNVVPDVGPNSKLPTHDNKPLIFNDDVDIVPHDNDLLGFTITLPFKFIFPEPVEKVPLVWLIFPLIVTSELKVGLEFTITVDVLSTPKIVFEFTVKLLFTAKLLELVIDIIIYYIFIFLY